VIKVTNQFAELGVDAVSVITPYLIKLSDEELIQHYQTIALLLSLIPIICGSWINSLKTDSFIDSWVFAGIL
jgi:hypothetical protein